ncbi:hypothetical protein HII31_12445 [Pseudocercospora fuligena]|uniref:Uncharacterized protein n=1 Tax=Pseudocercospora fuligena TaxID=685502 RepID=A0A8H6R803_9PEZI|nr:hypothetical protein HII31_12445 [Pseudocercospora fuligena]
MNRTSTSDDRSRVNFGHIYSSDRELNEAIFSGLVATSPQDFLVKPSCSGNCTWDSIWTLAIESECQLINDQLINGTHLGPGGFTPPMLPNGFQLIRPSTQQGEDSVQFNLSGSYPTLAFLDRGYVLADFFLLYSADAYSPAQAVECVLQFAGHNVKAQTRNSVYTETSLTAPLFNNTKGARLCSPWLYYMAQNAPYNTTTDDIPLDEVTLAYLDVEACQLLLHDEAQDVTLDFSLGLLDTFPSKIAKVLTSTSGAYGADVALASLIGNYQTANLTMQDRVSNLAKSLSRAMRTSLLKGLPLATTDIRKDVVTYQVIWSWITLPASLVGLSIVLLILTIFDTRRKDVSRWTDSALALIAYGGYRAIEPAMHHGADLETWEGFARQQEVMMGERGVLIAKF